MTHIEIKEGILDLWMKSYHGRSEQLTLLVDTYYKDELTVYHAIDSKIVGAIMGIPYKFGYGENCLKGLFLYGLIVEEKFRHRGIMSGMLKEINEKVSNDYDFTFLIPVSDLNADFYRRRGYFNSFFLLEERFTSVHDFYNDFIYTLAAADQRVKSLKESLYDGIKIEKFDGLSTINPERIIDFIIKWETKATMRVELQHSRKDLAIILNDNGVNDNSIFVSIAPDENITGVAFVEKHELKRLKVRSLYVEDACSYFAVLNHIKKTYPDYSISLFVERARYNNPSIIEEAYGASNPDGGDLDTLFGLYDTQFDVSRLMEPYGMVKLLRFDRILEYIASRHKEINLKLFIRDWSNPQISKESLFIVNNGKVKVEPADFNKFHKDHNILKLSAKEVTEILLRKKESSSVIMEAFGIPRLPLSMKLMPKI